LRRRYLVLVILPVIAAVAALTMFGGSAAPVRAQQTESVELFMGCNNVSLTWPDGTDTSTVADAVSPTSALEAIWRFNNVRQTFVGYSPRFPDVSDLQSVNRFDAVLVCMSAPGTMTRPAPVSGEGTTWASLGQVQPLRVERSTPIIGQSLATDPSDPERIAYCAPTAIQVTTDGGATWSAVPVAPVVDIAAASLYPLITAGGVPPACVSLALDPAFPNSVYAVFQATKAPFGAPPIIFVGYVTTDRGQTWQAVPVPDGLTMEEFGGFRVVGTTVEALFSVPAAEPGAPPSFAVERTVDGGTTWTTAQPDCPDAGPCVRWGPAPNAIGSCAMNGRFQPIDASTDGGATWTPSGPPGPFGPAGANACNLNELVALSPTDVLLIAEDAALTGGGAQPVEISRDGGQTWSAVTLPSLPGGEPLLLHGLQVLPDGALIVRPQDSRWMLLSPGAPAWCAIPAGVLDAPFDSADTARVIGGRLWWLENTDPGVPPQNTTPTPHSVALDSLTCGAGG
jgi:photosystem II stability/assembly factor-like uncharacterized protein